MRRSTRARCAVLPHARRRARMQLLCNQRCAERPAVPDRTAPPHKTAGDAPGHAHPATLHATGIRRCATSVESAPHARMRSTVRRRPHAVGAGTPATCRTPPAAARECFSPNPNASVGRPPHPLAGADREEATSAASFQTNDVWKTPAKQLPIIRSLMEQRLRYDHSQ